MKFINVNGVLQRARRFVSGGGQVQEDEVRDPQKLAEIIRQMQRRLSELESVTPPEGQEFEVNVGSGGALTSIAHNVGGPVRWSVVCWTQVGGTAYPVAAPALVQDVTSTSKTLVLRSYVAGKAIVRVESAFADVDPGITVAASFIPGAVPDPATASVSGMRLTVTNGVPVPSADVAGGTTLYLAPYVSGQLRLYYGGFWAIRNTAQVSIAVPNTNNTNYDVFAFWNGSAVALELVAWTSSGAGTSVRVALGTQDGVKVKASDPTRLYVGTVRTGATLGQVPDTAAIRFVWNQYNRVRRELVLPLSSSWSYVNPNGVWRQTNNNTACLVQCVVGDTAEIRIHGSLGCTVSASSGFAVGVGVNATTVNSAQTFGQWAMGASFVSKAECEYYGSAAAGYQTYKMLETGQLASGTYTFQGSGVTWGSGLTGDFWA
jgi:hypothetical protein